VIVDFRRVAEAMRDEVIARGGVVRLDAAVTRSIRIVPIRSSTSRGASA